jgi:hypothetical protein
MLVTVIAANEQVLRHNKGSSAGPVSHSSNPIALQVRYVGCSAGFLSAHILYEPIIEDREDPTSVRCADMRLESTCASRRREKAAHPAAAARQ